jgi:hypothetical protein
MSDSNHGPKETQAAPILVPVPNEAGPIVEVCGKEICVANTKEPLAAKQARHSGAPNPQTPQAVRKESIPIKR